MKYSILKMPASRGGGHVVFEQVPSTFVHDRRSGRLTGVAVGIKTRNTRRSAQRCIAQRRRAER